MDNRKIVELANNIKGRKYAGSSTRDGKLYHDLPFEGLGSLTSHRGRTRKRIDKIVRHFNPRGKKVLDIGCSVGGLTLGMAEYGAEKAVGVDYATDSIEIGKEAARILNFNNVEFHVEEITIEWAKKLEYYDCIIWYSNWMWIVKQKGLEYAKELLFEVSKKTDIMFFESSSDDGMARIKGSTQDDIEKWLKENTVFRKIRRYPPTGGWMHRDVFIVYRPLVKLENSKRATTAVIERISRTQIKKKFLPGWEWQLERELESYKRLEKFSHYPKVHSFDIKDNSFIMDYCGACEWLRFPRMGEQALEILKEIKSVGITHRDIKHGNFLELNGILYLIDFGWAIFDNEKDSPIPAFKSMWWKKGFSDEQRIKGIFQIKE